MQTSKNQKSDSKKENADNKISAFSLSFDDFDLESDEKYTYTNVKEKIYRILVKEFISGPKTEIYEKEKMSGEVRLNFACPYCGDSHKDPYKKRGNIYIPGYNFHCYNCRTHTTVEKFLNDFGESIDPKEKVTIFNSRQNSSEYTEKVGSFENSYYINYELLDKFAVEREELKKKFNLIEMHEPKAFGIKKYLLGRLQTKMDNFLYDVPRHRLIILNKLPNGKILGFQIRNFRKEPKYVTYTLSMIYEKVLKKEVPESAEFKEANSLSFLFGLETVNLDRPIIVFEGPLDSFLCENGMSVCGIDQDFPLDIQVMWMYDYDKPGLIKSIERIRKGEYVFLWKKYLEENKIYNINKNKLDYTDFRQLVKEKNIKELDCKKYFSNNEFDIVDL